jgi:hypothetical protein
MKSKKILLALALFINLLSFGQTNTFPTTGNVGIGITNPKYKLDILTPVTGTETETYSGIQLHADHFGYIIEGGIKQKAGGTLKFSLNQGGTISEKFRIDSYGNVGIGTNNPTAKLEVAGNAKINGNLSFSNYGGGFFMQDNDWIRTYGNKNFYHNTGIMRTDGEFQVGPSGNRLVVNANGNVGIGTTAPASKLDVVGDIYIDNLDWSTDNALRIREGSSNSYGAFFKYGLNDLLTIGTRNEDSDYIALQVSRGSSNVTFNGNVGIGITDPKNKLSVNGTVWAKEVKVSLTDAADWVFDTNYKLRPLAEVEKFINENKHLPELPSAEEFRQNDMNVSQMSNKLLQKIEELTLYAIEQQKELDRLKTENENYKSLAERLSAIEKELKK